MLNIAVTGFFSGLSLIIAIGAQNAYVLRLGLMRTYVGSAVAICAVSDAILIVAGTAGMGALVAQNQILLNTGQAIYPIPVDTIDLMDMVIRTQPGTLNQIDINISRISESTYMTLPNKLAQGRPIQVWVNRQSGQSNPTTAVLVGNILSTDTTITVSDASQLGSSGFIQLDNEIISYPNINGNQLIIIFQ